MEIKGMKKRVDDLGRICIPKPMRELYGLNGEVELVVTDEGILLRTAVFPLKNACYKKCDG